MEEEGYWQQEPGQPFPIENAAAVKMPSPRNSAGKKHLSFYRTKKMGQTAPARSAKLAHRHDDQEEMSIPGRPCARWRASAGG